jgi:hypothetical protein
MITRFKIFVFRIGKRKVNYPPYLIEAPRWVAGSWRRLDCIESVLEQQYSIASLRRFLEVLRYPSFLQDSSLGKKHCGPFDVEGTIIRLQTVTTGISMVLLSPFGSMVPIIGDLVSGGHLDPV